MNNMIIGVLLFVLGCLTSYYMLLQCFADITKRLADKYEQGDVDKLLGRK